MVTVLVLKVFIYAIVFITTKYVLKLKVSWKYMHMYLTFGADGKLSMCVHD